MLPIHNLTGQRFGRLAVIQPKGKDNQGKTVFVCLCDCGNLHPVTGHELRNGHTRSCGCLQREYRQSWVGLLRLKHGYSPSVKRTPEYRSYTGAKQRCTNPNHEGYPDYGGRGIKFLFHSFEEFLAELGPKPEPKHLYSVDRFPNNDGPYAVGNVRWATRSEQRLNRRVAVTHA